MWSIFDFHLSKNCVLTSKATREEVDDDNPVAGTNNPTILTQRIINYQSN